MECRSTRADKQTEVHVYLTGIEADNRADGQIYILLLPN